MLNKKRVGNNTFDVARYRRDFPVLSQTVYGKPLIYLDNAATTQKPQQVIDALRDYYETGNANIHRGIFYLSQRATQDYEAVRVKVQQFIHARAYQEVIFVRGTTEGINLVAQSYGGAFLKEGDEIIISAMEHHSNIVPWQIVCMRVGTRLRIAPINDEGELEIDAYEQLFNQKTKLVAVTHVSNSLGTINPVHELIEIAHRRQVPVLIDGAQAVPHMAIDVQDLDCDFYVFSGHKMYGPTGVGVVYGKAELLEKMPPYQGGGDMISSVTFERTQYNVLPFKFEAGTPNIADVIAFGHAIDYLGSVGYSALSAHEHSLLVSATEALSKVKGLRIIGTAKEKASVLSFVLRDVHPHDIGTLLDRDGIAIRAGHHCTMPLMARFGVPATARASFAFYNTHEEVDALARSVGQVVEVFK